MKISLTRLPIPAALALLLVLSGCASAPERHPKDTRTVVLAADRPARDVEIEVVSAVEIVLPSGPAGSAGDLWEIASNNVRVLEQMGPMKPEAPGDALAAPVTRVRFYALKPGKSVLRFVLVRPGVAEETPAAQCAVVVRVSDY
jgi:hypothetical protein